MPDLMLDVPQRLMAELRDWAKLRRGTVEEAAVEMMRIRLHAVREREQPLRPDLDVPDDGKPH
jgi:hypothetical protein